MRLQNPGKHRAVACAPAAVVALVCGSGRVIGCPPCWACRMALPGCARPSAGRLSWLPARGPSTLLAPALPPVSPRRLTERWAESHGAVTLAEAMGARRGLSVAWLRKGAEDHGVRCLRPQREVGRPVRRSDCGRHTLPVSWTSLVNARYVHWRGRAEGIRRARGEDGQQETVWRG